VSEKEEAEILATFDPIGAMAGRDDDILAQVLAESDLPEELQAIARGEFDPDAFVPKGGNTDPDEVPEPPVDPITKMGDLWLLGEHRLLAGDSTKAEDVARLFDRTVPFLCVTDPPYGVNYDPAWRNVEAKGGRLAYADRRVGPVTNDNRVDWSAAWALFPGDVIYSWHPADATSLIHAAALQKSGFTLRMQIIWAKSNFPIGRGDYHVRHEPCWYAVRDGKASKRTDDRTQTTLWEINLDRNVEGGHSTQKPVECMARAIRNHDAPEVYDPFLGSGTTLIAAEQLGRRCYSIEIEPQYVDVAVRRWENFTGKQAEIEKR
jgi:DNA modification methylase